MTDGLDLSLQRMREHGEAEMAARVFAHYYRQVVEGVAVTIPEGDIEPATADASLADLPADHEALSAAMAQTVVVKLNGGLGTTMGVSGAKAALQVTRGLTFLDIMAKQVLAQRRRYGASLPLVLMHSFRTRAVSLAALDRYPELSVGSLNLDFLQNAVPRLRADDLTPVIWAPDPDLEWCPPGHGDLYVAMRASGTLTALREHGYRYAFVSNADNLGATPDARVPAWMAEHDVPFVMEVCRRTASDRKGGHLARRLTDGRLILRERAMTEDSDLDTFQDIERHALFNTNNLWIDLDVLDRLLTEGGGVIGLPLMVNRKTVDPTNPNSTPVLQLETAIGTAIEAIDGATALLVGRDRFKPVKTTNDFLVLRSDFYQLTPDVRLVPTRDGDEPFVDLDPRYFAVLAEFDRRFAAGVPSLRECTSLRVRGDVTFGAGVVCRGDVSIEVPEGESMRVPDGTILG